MPVTSTVSQQVVRSGKDRTISPVESKLKPVRRRHLLRVAVILSQRIARQTAYGEFVQDRLLRNRRVRKGRAPYCGPHVKPQRSWPIECFLDPLVTTIGHLEL